MCRLLRAPDIKQMYVLDVLAEQRVLDFSKNQAETKNYRMMRKLEKRQGAGILAGVASGERCAGFEILVQYWMVVSAIMRLKLNEFNVVIAARQSRWIGRRE
jgi:hypothetical protein